MKKLIILAATATLAFTGIATAQPTAEDRAGKGRSIDAQWGRNVDAYQPSGGRVSEDLAAPTAGISGSVTGAAHMNGPSRNGQSSSNPFLGGSSTSAYSMSNE